MTTTMTVPDATFAVLHWAAGCPDLDEMNHAPFQAYELARAVDAKLVRADEQRDRGGDSWYAALTASGRALYAQGKAERGMR